MEMIYLIIISINKNAFLLQIDKKSEWNRQGFHTNERTADNLQSFSLVDAESSEHSVESIRFRLFHTFFRPY